MNGYQKKVCLFVVDYWLLILVVPLAVWSVNFEIQAVRGHAKNAAMECEETLSVWEWDFINSIADQEKDLTEKQNAVLNRIAEKTGR